MSKKLVSKIKEIKEPLFIFVCGMPGTRKSSTSVKLGAALGFSSIVGMDEVRDVMKIYDKRAILNGKSHDRWKLFGLPTKRNFNRGYLEHCRALQKGVRAIIRKNIKIGENTIFEGVHAVPSLYGNIKGVKVIHVVLTAESHAIHKKLLQEKFDRRHGIQKAWVSEKVRHVEQIQEFLLENAKKCGAIVISSTTPEKNCVEIIGCLEKLI